MLSLGHFNDETCTDKFLKFNLTPNNSPHTHSHTHTPTRTQPASWLRQTEGLGPAVVLVPWAPGGFVCGLFVGVGAAGWEVYPQRSAWHQPVPEEREQPLFQDGCGVFWWCGSTNMWAENSQGWWDGAVGQRPWSGIRAESWCIAQWCRVTFLCYLSFFVLCVPELNKNVQWGGNNETFKVKKWFLDAFLW